METYKIQNLSFTYPQCDKPAIENINLTINRGEFITICGKSGCGKSTLLRNLKKAIAPFGDLSGDVWFCGNKLEDVDFKTQACQIGYVLQNPDNQIVTDKVWHELAFGLESIGVDSADIRVKVAEMASFFNMEDLFLKDVENLSGGQKQLLNLASIMAMQPSVLILDEPTSQLDPIAAVDFLETIKKINSEIGTTVILSEHRLEDVLPMSDRVIVMEDGKIIIDDVPSKIGERLKELNNNMFAAMPASMQIYAGVKNKLACPITVKEGRMWLDNIIDLPKIKSIKENKQEYETILKLKDIWFKYDMNSDDVIKGINLNIKKGIFAIVGGNGAGKSTLLSVICGILKPYRGKITNKNKITMLPQNPQTLFVKSSVKDDLLEIVNDENKVMEVAKLTEIDGLLKKHPYDLSGGEQQRAALAKVLLTNPEILLLDEPTKGIDGYFKIKLAGILNKLKDKGVTIVLVSHDIEFCARYADNCAMLFNGDIVSQNTPREFFSSNNFYTTAANKMSRHIFENAVTSEDVIKLCNENL